MTQPACRKTQLFADTVSILSPEIAFIKIDLCDLFTSCEKKTGRGENNTLISGREVDAMEWLEMETIV